MSPFEIIASVCLDLCLGLLLAISITLDRILDRMDEKYDDPEPPHIKPRHWLTVLNCHEFL